MSLAANSILRVKGRQAVYRPTPDADGVPVRAIISEGAAEIRAGRSQLVGYQAEATVPSSLAPNRYGTLQVDSTVYEIVEILRGSTPGLTDLGLQRLSGPQLSIDRFGAGRAILLGLGRAITLDGRQVRAQVSQRGVAEETMHGQMVEVVRTVVSIADADAEGVAPGAPAIVDGDTYHVRALLPNGRGLTLVVLE